MDAFVTPCAGWYNVINNERIHILIHPFDIGERYLPIYCPFGSSYVASVHDRLNYTIVFETNMGNYTMQFYGLSEINTKNTWIKPNAIRTIPRGYINEGMFYMNNKLYKRVISEKNTVRCKRDMLMGYIDSWKIDYIIIELIGSPIIDMSDYTKLYASNSVLCVWEGSQMFMSSLKSPHKRTDIPLSPAKETQETDSDQDEEYRIGLSPVFSPSPALTPTPTSSSKPAVPKPKTRFAPDRT